MSVLFPLGFNKVFCLYCQNHAMQCSKKSTILPCFLIHALLEVIKKWLYFMYFLSYCITPFLLLLLVKNSQNLYLGLSLGVE